MNWSLFEHSVLLAYGVAKMSLTLGTICALWAQTLSPRGQNTVTAGAAISLALPPFLVANTWMNFFGLAGVWRKWIDFDLYSWGGAILLMVLLLWPVTFFLIRAALSRLETERIEADPLLRGWKLIRWVLWPHLRGPLGTASVIGFVLALNHFSIPALLQTKVYSADVWVTFNANFNYAEALRIGWPLIVAPLLLILFMRDHIELSAARNPLDHVRFAESLGGFWRTALSIVSIGLLALSVGFPLIHLAANPKSWMQMAPAFAAGHSAFSASLITALGGATVGVLISLLLAKRKWSVLAWLPFLVPGVVTGILIIRIFNQPALAWIYPSFAMVIGALAVRYLALPLQAVAQARRSVDPDLTLAARADGATSLTAFWRAELPLLAGPLFLAWYIGYLFCLWDAETMTMIVPPGGETLALRVFNMLHYGHTEQVSALCLWLLGLAVAPLVFRGVIAWKKSETPHVVSYGLVGAMALFLAGCSGAPENGVKVESKLFSHVETWGRRGNGVGEFNKPRALACDAQDNVYVVDMTGRVQKFSPNGQYLLSWQMPQTDKGKPKGMEIDRAGGVIVVEPHYNRINHYSADGKLVYQWDPQGTNAGQLYFPRSIAVNSKGELYISEYGMVERVQRFGPRGTNFLGIIGKGAGEGPGEFRRAEGVGIDAQDRLFVADSCNHRVQIFSREGDFIREHGKAGSGTNEMSYPYDVRIDRAGYEYVCEFGNSRIQVFDRDGRFVEFLGGVGGEPSQMNNPWSICLDSKGNLYVADSGNHRVQKFVQKSALAQSPHKGATPNHGGGG